MHVACRRRCIIEPHERLLDRARRVVLPFPYAGLVANSVEDGALTINRHLSEGLLIFRMDLFGSESAHLLTNNGGHAWRTPTGQWSCIHARRTAAVMRGGHPLGTGEQRRSYVEDTGGHAWRTPTAQWNSGGHAWRTLTGQYSCACAITRSCVEDTHWAVENSGNHA